MYGATEIDIVLMSYGSSDSLIERTHACIHSLTDSEDDSIKFNTIIIESNRNLRGFTYSGSFTVVPQEAYNYNRFLNIGIKLSESKFICLCKHDIIFHRNWATRILNAFQYNYDLTSVSPFSAGHHEQLGYKYNTGLCNGYRNRFEIVPWCIFLKRDAFRLIGELDENYACWCNDVDFAYTLRVLRLRHALVTNSLVQYANINRFSDLDQPLLSQFDHHYFAKKWNPRLQSLSS
jgi:GT2 family glycosyltransferase